MLKEKKSVLCLIVLMFCSIISLFEVKFKVDSVRQDLLETKRQIIEEDEALHVLQAEWSHLNKSQRLASLAKKYLNLRENSDSSLLVIENVDANFAKIIELQLSLKGQEDQNKILQLASKNISKSQTKLIGVKKWRFKKDSLVKSEENNIVNVSFRKK